MPPCSYDSGNYVDITGRPNSRAQNFGVETMEMNNCASEPDFQLLCPRLVGMAHSTHIVMHRIFVSVVEWFKRDNKAFKGRGRTTSPRSGGRQAI